MRHTFHLIYEHILMIYRIVANYLNRWFPFKYTIYDTSDISVDKKNILQIPLK